MSFKRKCLQTRVEISSSSQDAPTTNTNVMACTITFGHSRPTGHLAEQSDTADIAISAEDLATLQEHAEFSFPAESFLDFETSLQDVLQEGESVPAGDTAQAQTRVRIYSVQSYTLYTLLTIITG